MTPCTSLSIFRPKPTWAFTTRPLRSPMGASGKPGIGRRSVGAGKNKTSVVDHWDVVGVESLASAGYYGEFGSGSHQNRKDFTPQSLNAVVVLDDPFKRNNPNSDTLVILTNAPVQKPLKATTATTSRSEIENGLFREAKQAWFIQRPPEQY